jgi:hypothetical protein
MSTFGRRVIGVVGVAGVGAALLLAGGTASARATTAAPPPAGASLITLGGHPGEEIDPHVSGNLVAYTSFPDDEPGQSGQIVVHDLATGTDRAVGNGGGSDILPDISGTTVTYTHATASGAHDAYRYDYPAGPPTVVDPQTAAGQRRISRVGGATFVFQDFGYPVGTPEITGFDATTGVATRLTDDALYDADPAVSQDGGTTVWSKCASIRTACHVWQATRGASGWSAPQQLTAAGDQGLPDTDGTYVVYGTTPAGGGQLDENIAWQPVGGGPERLLDIPGLQDDPSISNGVIAFEQYDATASPPNFNIWLYDIVTDTLHQLTDTPEDESLPDVSVSADRTVTVAWSIRTIYADDDVQVDRFRLPLVPDTVTLTPAAGSGQVGSSHTVQADVRSGGSEVAGVPVRFAVAGAVNDTETCTTGSTGTCSITYQGPSQPGTDTITAYADTNGNGTRDDGEPQGTAAWSWEDTASTTGDAAGTGQISGPHGRVNFLFAAHSGTRSLAGACLVFDPQQRVTIMCSDVTRYVENGSTATIEGHAWVNGTSTSYTITAQDNGSRGRGDTFGIATASGYSASGPLASGDVLVH